MAKRRQEKRHARSASCLPFTDRPLTGVSGIHCSKRRARVRMVSGDPNRVVSERKLLTAIPLPVPIISCTHLSHVAVAADLTSAPTYLNVQPPELSMTRDQATQAILEAKSRKGLTFEALARAVGRHKVWVTSALLGQATMSAEEAHKATEM